MKINLKNKIIILVLLLLMVVGLIGYFVIWKTIRDIREISSAIRKEREDLEIKYQKGQLIKKIAEDFEKAKPLKDKISEVFIPKGEELKFITVLEKIAQELNIEQKIKLETQKIQEKRDIKILPLEIALGDDFIQILKYLDKLARLDYYFNISNLNFMADREMTGAVNVLIKGKAFSK